MPKRVARRTLETPHLARIVPQLSPDALHRLIHQFGLEASGALVGHATPAQLSAVLDVDFWQATPLESDRFDVHRFGCWVEMLMNEGEALAVRVVARMDRSLVVLALSHYIRVFDAGVLPSAECTEIDQDVGQHVSLETEIGGYVVHAKTAHAWDAIVALLIALDGDDPDCFQSLMHGCRGLSNSTPERDGLDDLLVAPDQFLYDVAEERQARRTRQGYINAADARAFLEMTRGAGAGQRLTVKGIVAAYFRELDDESVVTPAGGHPGAAPVSSDPEEAAAIAAIGDALTRGGAVQLRGLLAPGGDEADTTLPLLGWMSQLQATHESCYYARLRELGFLANALLAGSSVYSRNMTKQEARDGALGICNLGFEQAMGRNGSRQTPQVDMMATFEAGWRLLHEHVSIFITDRLIATLGELRCLDTEIDREQFQLRRELARHRAAGEPWRVGDTLDVIGMLDMPTWACLRGLLSECPVLPSAMTAMRKGHARSVSATAFEFFASWRQVGIVHEFAATLTRCLVS